MLHGFQPKILVSIWCIPIFISWVGLKRVLYGIVCNRIGWNIQLMAAYTIWSKSRFTFTVNDKSGWTLEKKKRKIVHISIRKDIYYHNSDAHGSFIQNKDHLGTWLLAELIWWIHGIWRCFYYMSSQTHYRRICAATHRHYKNRV